MGLGPMVGSAGVEPGQIGNAAGRVVFDADIWTQVTTGDCPPTVHPSLWRQSKGTEGRGVRW